MSMGQTGYTEQHGNIEEKLQGVLVVQYSSYTC